MGSSLDHTPFFSNTSQLVPGPPGPAAWALKPPGREASLCKIPPTPPCHTMCPEAKCWTPLPVRPLGDRVGVWGRLRSLRICTPCWGMNTWGGAGRQVLTWGTQLCTKILLVALRGPRTLSLSSSQSPYKHPCGPVPQNTLTWG